MTREENLFSFSSNPKPVKVNNKYRDESKSAKPSISNFMSDSRVARVTPTTKSSIIKSNRLDNSKKQSTHTTGEHNANSQPYYHFLYNYSSNDNFNLDSYLIEAKDGLKPINSDKPSQTDDFIEKPQDPPFIPRKTGLDRSTQVTLEDSLKLFSFDREVDPLITVLVHKSIEQALFEVNSEEALYNIKKLQEGYIEIEAKHKHWVNVEHEKAFDEIMNKSLVVDEASRRQNELYRFKCYIAGKQLLNQIFPDVFQSIQNDLYDSNIWEVPDKVYCRQHVIPELIERSNYIKNIYDASGYLIDDIIEAVNTSYDEIINTTPVSSANDETTITVELASNQLDEDELDKLPVFNELETVTEENEDSSQVDAESAGNNETTEIKPFKKSNIVTLGPWTVHNEMSILVLHNLIQVLFTRFVG